jgi:hypothetical protein
MRINKFSLVMGFVLSTILLGGAVAHADEMDQYTNITFSQPVVIPGQTLQAGTYLFKLLKADDLNLIQISSLDGSHVYATLLTNSTERPMATGDTELVMAEAEQGSGNPVAILKWFYPGRTDGHEFVYSEYEMQQLAQDRHRTIVAKDHAEAGE